MKNNNIYIYDLEQFLNFHSGIFYNVDTKEYVSYIIHESNNQFKEYVEFLNKCVTNRDGFVGYNNINYDYPLLHFIIKNQERLLTLDVDDLVMTLYDEGQRIINEDYSAIYLKDTLIPQLDIYKIRHYDNKARACSLKWLEFSLRWHKLQDLPFPFDSNIEEKDIPFVMDYNKNDVDFTYELYTKIEKDITFRRNTTVKLGHNVMNYSDVKIGEYMNQITYSKLANKPYYRFKKGRTYQRKFKFSDIVHENIKFKSKYLSDFLERLKKREFLDTDSVEEYLRVGDLTLKFALGGIHSEDKPRVVKCKEGHILQEKDIGSMYPWTIVSDNLYPRHLGEEWNAGIKEFFNHRSFVLKPKLKTLDKKSKEYEKVDAEQAVYKLAMNGGGFGKLGSDFSWQYDPLIKFKVTVNGQLRLLMLMEDLDIAGIELISANTDGVVVHYPKSRKAVVDNIHKEWEKYTTYILEDTDYKQLIFSSVNDYIAEIINPDTGETIKYKYKGDYEIDKEWHKNNSQRIVPIAISNYFIKGIPVKETIENHDNIYDFCLGRKRSKSQLYFFVENGTANVIEDKVVRYYISNNYQNRLYKKYTEGKLKGREPQAVSKGFGIQLFMDYEKKDDYGINYDYYINECNKIINPVEMNTKSLNNPTVEQLNLF